MLIKFSLALLMPLQPTYNIHVAAVYHSHHDAISFCLHIHGRARSGVQIPVATGTCEKQTCRTGAGTLRVKFSVPVPVN